MTEMKVVTAMVLMKYEVMEEPTLKPKIIPRLVLRSLNGIHIRIKDVNQNWIAASSGKGYKLLQIFSVGLICFPIVNCI